MTELETAIKGILLLHKPDHQTRNVLAMLGLQANSFHNTKSPELTWDEYGICVKSKTLKNKCDCSGGIDPMTYPIAAGDFHSQRCVLSLKHKIANHSDLVEFDDAGDFTTWDFNWPRDISHARNVILTAFPELKDDTLWKNFQRAWKGITDQIGTDPEVDAALAETDDDSPMRNLSEPGAVDALREDLEITPDPDEDDYNPFHDAESFAGDGPLPVTTADEYACKPFVPLPDDDPYQDAPPVSFGTPSADLAEQILEKVEEIQEVKRGRGRPKGTTKMAKEQAKEIPAEGFNPETKADGTKVYPALVRYSNILEDELTRLTGIGNALRSPVESFPIETIRGIKDALDRMALRTATLESRGRHDDQDPAAINLMVEITLCNVTAVVNSAMRDLALCPEKPGSWETFGDNIKEALDIAKASVKYMSQVGMGPAIQEIPPPKEL